jgi:hypothetical protein
MRVMNKLIMKGVILLLDWIFKYVVLTNLGSRRFQSILKNLVSYILSEMIQAKISIAKSKC